MRARIITAILGLAVVIVLLFGLTYLAAQSSQPDSPLYGLKLFGETIRESLTGGSTNQFNLKLELVQRRFDEISYTVQTSGTIPEKVTQRLQSELDQCLQLAALNESEQQSAALMKIYELLVVQETILTNLKIMVLVPDNSKMDSLMVFVQERRQLVEFGLQNPSAFQYQMLTGEMPVVDEMNSIQAEESTEQAKEVEATASLDNTPTTEETQTPTPTTDITDVTDDLPPDLDDLPPDFDFDTTVTPEPTLSDDFDDLPPDLEGTIVTITPGGDDVEDIDLPPDFGDDPVYTATPGSEDWDDEPPDVDEP